MIAMRDHQEDQQAAGPRNRSQGTVWDFDADTGRGTVVLDDGRPVGFSPDVFRTSGLRLLRRGQRLRMTLDASDVVTSLTILTLADPDRSDTTSP